MYHFVIKSDNIFFSSWPKAVTMLICESFIFFVHTEKKKSIIAFLISVSNSLNDLTKNLTGCIKNSNYYNNLPGFLFFRTEIIAAVL